MWKNNNYFLTGFVYLSEHELQVNAYGGYLEYAFRYHINTSMPFENLQKSYLANYDIIIEVITEISYLFWV